MKKLSKISLKDAVVLDDTQLKAVFGGSGASQSCSGTTKETCTGSCTATYNGETNNGTCTWTEITYNGNTGYSCGCKII